VTEETLACQLTVRGHVQGVFFRDAVRREAARRGVDGWAANRPDGTVEVVLEGPSEQVKHVIDYCRRGPRGATVTDVEVGTIEPRGLSGFQIR
jgi:acylphosphatase